AVFPGRAWTVARRTRRARAAAGARAAQANLALRHGVDQRGDEFLLRGKVAIHRAGCDSGACIASGHHFQLDHAVSSCSRLESIVIIAMSFNLEDFIDCYGAGTVALR